MAHHAPCSSDSANAVDDDLTFRADVTGEIKEHIAGLQIWPEGSLSAHENKAADLTKAVGGLKDKTEDMLSTVGVIQQVGERVSQITRSAGKNASKVVNGGGCVAENQTRVQHFFVA